jgi:thiol-disulfide isomerase/thioredoxin
MKAFFSVIALQFILLTPVIASEFKQIELTDFKTSEAVYISEFDENKPTYIKLWATWCKPCMEQMPHFQSLQEEYGDKINIFAVNININEGMKYIKDVVTKNGLTMPVLLDKEGKLSEVLGLVGTPYSVLINTDNDIVYTTHESGTVLDSFIDKLASGSKLASESGKTITAEERTSIIEPWTEGNHTLFFTATWCDWYLKDSRPEMAKNCEKNQSNIDKLYGKSEKKMAWFC